MRSLNYDVVLNQGASVCLPGNILALDQVDQIFFNFIPEIIICRNYTAAAVCAAAVCDFMQAFSFLIFL